MNKPNQLLLECRGQIAKILTDWGERGRVQGGEKEQKSKIPPETLTPQLDTEPTAFRLRHISHRDRYVGFHPEETRSWFIQSELFNTAGSLCLNVHSFWCSE